MHYLEGLDCSVDVVRNDAVDMEKIERYDKIVLSPGPGLPEESNLLMKVVEKTVKSKPVFGVCLGFQAIFEHFGGSLYNQKEVKHGVAEKCSFETNSKLFQDLPDSFDIGLYHSWAADGNVIPKTLSITARSKNEVIMAFEHINLPVCGVQFHPESILTENGKKIIDNFIRYFN